MWRMGSGLGRVHTRGRDLHDKMLPTCTSLGGGKDPPGLYKLPPLSRGSAEEPWDGFGQAKGHCMCLSKNSILCTWELFFFTQNTICPKEKLFLKAENRYLKA